MDRGTSGAGEWITRRSHPLRSLARSHRQIAFFVALGLVR